MSAHSWEDPGRQWEWAGDANAWAHNIDTESVDYWNVSKSDAELQLFEFVVSLKQSNKISAKQACLLAFWASRSGAGGDIRSFALPPGCQSGKYSAKFDRCLGHPRDENHYYLQVPQLDRSADERRVAPLPTIPPHEACADHVRDRREELEVALATTTLPRCFYTHPVVTSAAPGALVLPFILYLDAVSFSREDSILGLWVVCMLTHRRFLCASLKRSNTCKCGCRGWCSLWPLFSMLSWSLSAMASGRYPLTAHDGGALDPLRATFANRALGFIGALVFLKGDWSEYAHTLGFPDWSSITHPCMLCSCHKGTAYDSRGLSLVSFPWRKKGWREYEQACRDCEVVIDPLTHDMWKKILSHLSYERRTDEVHGRCLLLDIPELGLLRGDRLEPCPTVPDTGQGFNSRCPARAVFWRHSKTSPTHHRNPIFSERIGVTPERVLVADWLHAMSLGVLKYFLGSLCWMFFGANAWSTAPASEVRLERSVAKLKGELFAWYGSEARAGREHCRVQALQPSMFGSQDNPQLKLHAAEVNGFLYFAGWLLERRGGLLGRLEAPCKVAQDSFARALDIVRENPVVLSAEAQQEFLTSMQRALRATSEAGVLNRPKNHIVLHMAHDVREKGSPMLHATWADESANRLLKAVSAGSHARFFYERVLHSMQEQLARHRGKTQRT